jgi:hypothetical protein
VTTGQYARHQLASADVVITELPQLTSALHAFDVIAR